MQNHMWSEFVSSSDHMSVYLTLQAKFRLAVHCPPPAKLIAPSARFSGTVVCSMVGKIQGGG